MLADFDYSGSQARNSGPAFLMVLIHVQSSREPSLRNCLHSHKRLWLFRLFPKTQNILGCFFSLSMLNFSVQLTATTIFTARYLLILCSYYPHKREVLSESQQCKLKYFHYIYFPKTFSLSKDCCS